MLLEELQVLTGFERWLEHHPGTQMEEWHGQRVDGRMEARSGLDDAVLGPQSPREHRVDGVMEALPVGLQRTFGCSGRAAGEQHQLRVFRTELRCFRGSGSARQPLLVTVKRQQLTVFTGDGCRAVDRK